MEAIYCDHITFGHFEPSEFKRDERVLWIRVVRDKPVKMLLARVVGRSPKRVHIELKDTDTIKYVHPDKLIRIVNTGRVLQ